MAALVPQSPDCARYLWGSEPDYVPNVPYLPRVINYLSEEPNQSDFHRGILESIVNRHRVKFNKGTLLNFAFGLKYVI